MARRMKTAQEAADKYGARVTQAGPDYTKGVQNGGSWVDGAIAASGRRNAGLQRAISNGSIDRGIQNLGDAAYKQKTLAKGPQNYVNSVQNAKPAYAAGMQTAMQYQQAAAQATAGIDTSTRAGRLQKMAVWAQTVAEQSDAAKGR